MFCTYIHIYGDKMKRLLKLKKITKGMNINLPEEWSAKLEKFQTINETVRNFVLVDIVKKKRETFYILESRKRIKGEKLKIATTQQAIRYLTGEKITDEENSGYSFDKYLPEEGDQILITNNLNPSEVIPAEIVVEVGIKDFSKEPLLLFSIRANYLNGKGFATTGDFTRGERKSRWKFIRGNEFYMTPFEKVFCDTIVHKQFVKMGTEKLAKYLDSINAKNHARRLRYRGEVHDNGKLEDPKQLYALSRIIDFKYEMKYPKGQVDPQRVESIQVHQYAEQGSEHHPENHGNVLDMTRLDVMEMVCDWWARSKQFDTDFIDRVYYMQENRFNFPKFMFEEILFYAKILES